MRVFRVIMSLCAFCMTVATVYLYLLPRRLPAPHAVPLLKVDSCFDETGVMSIQREVQDDYSRMIRASLDETLSNIDWDIYLSCASENWQEIKIRAVIFMVRLNGKNPATGESINWENGVAWDIANQRLNKLTGQFEANDDVCPVTNEIASCSVFTTSFSQASLDKDKEQHWTANYLTNHVYAALRVFAHENDFVP